jgi:hypothetical protein
MTRILNVVSLRVTTIWLTSLSEGEERRKEGREGMRGEEKEIVV